MTDKPIIFSAPMIQAIAAGRKTMTRRLLRVPRAVDPTHFMVCRGSIIQERGIEIVHWPEDDARTVWMKPPYAAGDRLWIREAWQLHSRASDLCAVVYKASIRDSWTEAHNQFPDALAANMKPRPFQEGWRSSIHMPRAFSRTTLVVKAVKVERLHDISAEDAVAEGILRSPHGNRDLWCDYPLGSSAAGWIDPRHSFESLWESIHGAEAWEANPFVVAIAFETHLCNIDALPVSA